MSKHNPLRAPRAKSNSSTTSDGSSSGLLPTPSPELSHAADIFEQPTWEVLRDDTIAGAKRSHHDDYFVDDLFADVKKRRIDPIYDSHMVERLNHLAYAQHMATGPGGHYHPSHQAFQSRSISFDIRSPEELAAVNEFLLTLGRNVAAPGVHSIPPPTSYPPPPPPPSHHVRVPHASNLATENYFDPISLSQLGLTGMPGIPDPFDPFTPSPPSQHSYPTPTYEPDHLGARHPPITIPNAPYSTVYPNLSSTDYPTPVTAGPRRVSSAQYPSSPLDAHSRSSASPLGDPASLSSYDYTRAPPRTAIPPQLASVELLSGAKNVRTTVPLKSVPTSRPSSSSSAESRPDATKPGGSLYPLLNAVEEGDALKLPPLYRNSPGSDSSDSSSVSSLTPSPPLRTTTLPSLRAAFGWDEREGLANKVASMDLDQGEFEVRKKHALLIRDLLVHVNNNFKAQQAA